MEKKDTPIKRKGIITNFHHALLVRESDLNWVKSNYIVQNLGKRIKEMILQENTMAKKASNLVNGLATSEDEIDRPLDRATLEVMPAFHVPQCVLQPREPDPVEVGLVAEDHRRRGRSLRVLVDRVVVRVLPPPHHHEPRDRSPA